MRDNTEDGDNEESAPALEDRAEAQYGRFTSMASPHVAGAAALYVSDHPGASPAKVRSDLQAAGNFNWFTTGDRDGIQERLLNVDALEGTTIGGGTPPPSGITLTARGYKVKGRQQVDLNWAPSGGSGTVDVLRNGLRVFATTNDGGATDSIGAKGGGSYSYRVCQTGTSTCSNFVTVTF